MWAYKIVFGLLIAAVAIGVLYSLDLLQGVFLVIMLPIIALYGFNLIGNGTYEFFSSIGPRIVSDLKNRVELKKEEILNGEEAAEAA